MPPGPMNETDAIYSAELTSGPPAADARNADHSADASAPVAVLPKPRKKRAPRPTFEDGALTRMFKFPSKKYPKSSYYVTDTEIIIRIRKARKKWKLILPKKRVVSYRTNRWFAKPRWIEVELTYTQAVRQGLHEPTEQPVRADATDSPRTAALDALPAARADEVVSTLSTAGEVTPQLEPVSEVEIEVEPESDGEPEPEDEAITGWVPDDDADPSMSHEEDADADEEAEEALADDLNDEGAALPLESATRSSVEGEFAPLILAGEQTSVAIGSDPAEASVEHQADVFAAVAPEVAVTVTTPEAAFEAPAEIVTAPFDERVAAPVALLPVERNEKPEQHDRLDAHSAIEMPASLPRPMLARPPMPVQPKRRYVEARLLAATLALAILSLSADWSGVADSTLANGSCGQGPQTRCADDGIVTGSIAVVAARESAVVSPPSAAEPQTLPDLPPNPSADEQVRNPQNLTEGVEVPDGADRQDVVVALNTEAEVRPPVAPLQVQSPPIEHVRPAEPVVVPLAAQVSQQSYGSADTGLCSARATSIAKATVIQFAFASATLPLPGGDALAQLAATLKQCTSVQVLIEGHTDSDGDYFRNQSLSVRRAEAVRQHLVNAGAMPSQLTVIGYGQMRPLAPNDTATNKSRNRRIELVVPQ